MVDTADMNADTEELVVQEAEAEVEAGCTDMVHWAEV